MRPRLTLPQLWLALAVLLPGLAALLAAVSAVDLAYHLRAGSEMLDGGGLPHTDTYTFTVAGEPWLDQQWGAQVVLAGTWRAAGWTGLVLLRSILIAAAWACLVQAIRWRAPGLEARLVAALALGAFLVTAPAMALRPQLLAILLLCLTLALLAGRRRHPRLVWAVPVVVAAWANVHGSFVLGPLLAGLAWLEDAGRDPRRARGTFALAAVSGLAMLVNPAGVGAVRYALTLSSNRELAARVTEWQPPTVSDPAGILFFGSLALVIAVVVVRRRSVSWPAALTLLAFGALGLVAVRGVAWWPAVAVVTVAGLLPGRTAEALVRLPRPRALNTTVVALLLLAAVPLLPAWRAPDPGLGLDAPRGVLTGAPPGITLALREIAVQGDRLWNPQTWGSWFELAVPALTVAVDSRIELFPPAVWADYDTVAAARPGWQAVLDRRGATIVAVPAGWVGLRAALDGDPGWRIVAPVMAPPADEGAVFVRVSRKSGSRRPLPKTVRGVRAQFRAG